MELKATIYSIILGFLLFLQANGNIMDNLFSFQGKHIPAIMFPEEFLLEFARKINLMGIGEVEYNVTIKFSGKLRLFELEDHLITTGIAAGNYSLTQLVFDMNNRKLWIKNMFSGCRNFTTNKWINMLFDNFDSLWQLGTFYNGITKGGNQHIFNLNPIFESLPGSQKLTQQIKDSVGIQAFFDKQTETLKKMKVKIGNATLSFLTEGLKKVNYTAENFTDPSKWNCSAPAKNISLPMSQLLESFGNSSIGQLKTQFESMSQLFVGQSVDKLTNMLMGQAEDFAIPMTKPVNRKKIDKVYQQSNQGKQLPKGKFKGSVVQQKVKDVKQKKSSKYEGHNPYEM